MPIASATWHRRHPHQVLIAGVCVIAGLPILLGGPQPGSLSSTLPPVLVYVWAATFAVGGAMIVAAAVVRSVLWALYLELVADLPMATTALTYATALALVTGTRGLVALLFFAGVAAAFFVRFMQAGRTVRAVRQTLRESRPPE